MITKATEQALGQEQLCEKRPLTPRDRPTEGEIVPLTNGHGGFLEKKLNYIIRCKREIRFFI